MNILRSLPAKIHFGRNAWISEGAQLLIGSLIAAFAVNVFYVPVRLTMGGVSGIASIVYQLTGQGSFLSSHLLQ